MNIQNRLDLLAVQGTLKSLLQHHNFKSINSSAVSLLYGPTHIYARLLEKPPSGSGVKNPSTMQEKQVPSLGREDPLEGMASLCSILAWRIPWIEEPGGLQAHRVAELDMTEAAEHPFPHVVCV